MTARTMSEEELDGIVSEILGLTYLDMTLPLKTVAAIKALRSRLAAAEKVIEAASKLRNECSGVYAIGEVAIFDRALTDFDALKMGGGKG